MIQKEIESFINNPPTVGGSQSELDFNKGYDFALKQMLTQVPFWESKHQEELANYNSYAAGEVEERWQSQIDKMIDRYERTLSIINDVGGKDHITAKNYQTFIDDLKVLTID